jgi:hypothetical protein
MHLSLRTPFFPALLAAGALCACASHSSSPTGGSGRPAVSDRAYDGPAIAIDSMTGPRHLIVVTAPSPGWTVIFDQVSDAGDRVYITIRRPDPALLYPQVIVQQKLDSTSPIARPAEVYARVLGFNENAGTQPYRPAKATAK